MRPLTILAIALSLFVSANGQNPNESQHAKQTQCKTRFAVFQSNPHIPGGIAPGMSKEQGKWYEKNKNKYPSVCADGEKPEYFIVWSSRFASEGAPETVINFGGLTGYSGDTPVSASGYGASSPVASEYVYLSVFRATDVQRAQQEKPYKPMPVYYTQHDSWLTYRESHRKAMEDAMKFLAEAANK
jgi:hypothetical protein